MKANFSTNEVRNLTRKGVYFYEAADCFEQFELTSLPSKKQFYSSLSRKHITTEDHKFACKMWRDFKCKNRWDYHDLYLKTDVLLLMDVFENFRNLSTKTYSIDPAYYVSLPGFAFDAMLLKVDNLVKAHGGMHLMTDPDMYLMIERAIRGGVSMIIKRYAKANNKYMKNYARHIASSFIKYVDMNNLYGGAMCKKLPLNNFRWGTEEEVEQFDIESFDVDGDLGCFVECDIEYPEELHDVHNDYPLLPENVVVKENDQSDYLKQLRKKLGKQPSSKTGKLIPHLGSRTEYVVHIRNLQQAVQLGLKVSKIHRIVFFNQVAWMAPYINLNSSLRAKAKNTFEKDFYKLMNNAVFGKTMENVRKHFTIQILRDKHKDHRNRKIKYLNDLTLQKPPTKFDHMMVFAR